MAGCADLPESVLVTLPGQQTPPADGCPKLGPARAHAATYLPGWLAGAAWAHLQQRLQEGGPVVGAELRAALQALARVAGRLGAHQVAQHAEHVRVALLVERLRGQD